MLYKVEKKKYRLSKTFKKRLEAANKRLDRFGKEGLSSNEQKLYKDLIRVFNKKYGLSATDMFDPNKWYTKEQHKELRDLVESIYKEPKTSTRYWKKFYKDLKEGKNKRLKDLQDQFNFESEQDVIDFVDNMERFKSAALLQTILSSDQYQELVSYATKAMYRDVDKKLAEIYTKTGATKENLYNLMFDAIQSYEKQQKKQQEAVDNMWG